MKNRLKCLLLKVVVTLLVALSSGCASTWVYKHHATNYSGAVEEIVSYDKTKHGDYCIQVLGDLYKEGFGIYQLSIPRSSINNGSTYTYSPGKKYVTTQRKHLSFIAKNEDHLLPLRNPPGLPSPEIQHNRNIYLPRWDNGTDVIIVFKHIDEFDSAGKGLLPIAIVVDIITFPFQLPFWIYAGQSG